MANVSALLYYNWFRRYNVQADDMQALEDALLGATRGATEGLVGAAILEGFAISLPGGMQLSAGAGIACGPSGYLEVLPSTSTVTVTAPATGTTRNLVVVQPNPVTGTVIQDPIDPNNTDILTLVQQAVVTVIAGVASNSPVYPAVPAGATVLLGVRATSGQSTVTTADLDYSVQDTVGKNGLLTHATGTNDDRLRPYRNGSASLGIKPSQIEPPLPRAFSYVVPGSPSIFPKASGSYNPADTFLNFQSGAVTGGDTTTGSFTPTIPGAGQAIVATVGLTTSDTLAVKYGTAGTRAQCFSAIKNQTLAGAGGLSLPSAKLIAFVVLTSQDGANITELDFVDARGFSAFIASSSYPGYDVVVGGSGVVGATHATLAAAVADSAVGTNVRVLLADSQSIAPVSLTKAGWRIDALPGVTYTKGSGTTGITMAADGIEINELRFAGYTVSGNKAIVASSAGTYCRVNRCRFAVGTDTNIDESATPAGKNVVAIGNILEV